MYLTDGAGIFCNFVKTLKSSNLRSKFLKAFAMKRVYIFLVSALMLVSLYSCSTYRNTQTPDDVYYSPGVPATQAASAQTNNSDYYSTPNDNYVRMRVQDPNRWSYFDDYGSDYYANNYGYGYGYGSGVGLSFGFGSGFYSPFYGGFGYYSPLSFYNSYYAWNNFYNPYYGGVLIVNGKNTAAPGYTRMANFNPSAYQGRYYNTRPASNFSNGNSNRTSQNYYNRNNNFNRSNDSRPNYYSPSPTRSSNFNSGGSSGGGGGASRGGGFSRPGR
jgi:uncharacterized membrane protein YgcG